MGFPPSIWGSDTVEGFGGLEKTGVVNFRRGFPDGRAPECLLLEGEKLPLGHGALCSLRGGFSPAPPGAAPSLKSIGKLSLTLIRFGLGLSSHVKDTCVIKRAAAERSVSYVGFYFLMAVVGLALGTICGS